MKRLVTHLIISLIVVIIIAEYIKLNDVKVVIYENNRQTESGLLVSEISFSVKKDINEEYIINTKGTKFITLYENGDKLKTYEYSDLNIIKHVDATKLHGKFIVKDVELKPIYDTSILKDKLKELNNNRYYNEYASIEKGESNFIIKEEIIGNYIDIDALDSYIKSNIGKNLEIELSNYYIPFDTTKIRQSHYEEELNKIKNTYVSYKNGFKIQLIDFYTMLEIEDNNIKFKVDNEEELFETIDNMIEKELIEFDTVGNEKEFITTNGETIKVSGGTWGDIFSSDLETEYIIGKLKNFEHEEDRVPIMKQDYANEIPDTYIEVSINDQHIWYYREKELVMDSEIVTGTKGKHDTPHGVYYISEKIDGKYLRGDDYVTWVNKWLRITNRGHGLHDATWRGSFGGKIYTYNGSHGCINLPKKFAYKLFEEVDVGGCVIIY